MRLACIYSMRVNWNADSIVDSSKSDIQNFSGAVSSMREEAIAKIPSVLIIIIIILLACMG